MQLIDLFMSGYGKLILISLAVCLVMLILIWVRKQLSAWPLVIFFPLAAVLGYFGARGFYVLTHDVLTGAFYQGFFTAQPYAHAFCGAIIGVMAALALTACLTKNRFTVLADATAIPGMLLIALCRLSEYQSDFGWGSIVNDAGLQFFPLAVQDSFWHEWHLAVFNLEAFLALVFLTILLIRGRKQHRDGALFESALLWWSLGQIFCETIRTEVINWGFLPVQQLICAVFGLVILIRRGIQTRKSTGRFPAVPVTLYLLGIGVTAFLEFAVDKCPWPVWIDYTLMAVILTALGMMADRLIWPESREDASCERN